MTDTQSEYDLSRQIEAARLLVQHMKDIGADDDVQLVADTLEGELSIEEAIATAVRSIVEEDEVLIEGINKVRAVLETRRTAAQGRIERKRALILTAMQIAGKSRVVTPHRTVSIKKVAPSLNIVDESLIPAQFFERPEPVPQKRKLLDVLRGLSERQQAALKIDDLEVRQRELDDIKASQIPGVELSPETQTIQLR